MTHGFVSSMKSVRSGVLWNQKMG